MVAFRKPKKINPLAKWISLLAVGLFVAFFAYSSRGLIKEREELEAEIERMSRKVAEEQQRAEELKDFEIYTHTKKYAEEVAKDMLNYVNEGEIIFQPGD